MAIANSNQTQKPAVKDLAPRDETKIKAGARTTGDKLPYMLVTLKDAFISS